ncbi:MAG: thiamine pyrophosphate-binding protein [Capnocytophaga sp.]|nr:thiamine pyrophosphate-binding protein [Capnocytophaga sp.]
MSKNVSDVLVEMLVNAGVKRIYAITGDSLNPINDAVRRDGRLQWIHVRHEEVAAYAASMEAELHGIGCCMGSSGPGHVHLINGLYDANRSGNPVIAIASTANTAKLGREYFQETNVTKLFDDCSQYVFDAQTAQQAIQGCQAAIQYAISRQGVSVLGLPGDVAAASAEPVETTTSNFYPKTQLIPDSQSLNELASVINQHKNVMLYCGHGCKNAQEQVLQLAEKLKAPIGYSFRGKIFFDKEDNPYAVGLNGLLGNRSGFEAMHKADLVIMLGTDFPYSPFLPEKNTLVQIDIKPERLGRRGKIDYGYAGDIRQTVGALLPMVDAKNNHDFLDTMRKAHAKIEKDYDAYTHGKTEEKKIHPEYVASILNTIATDDAIFTVDTGMSAVWAARYIKGAKNRYLTGSFNHGSMANAMPMAIGAGISSPGRQIVAMCGDGGISMLLGDLMTVSQYNIPVKIIIFNNRTLGMVKLEMQVDGLPDWQTDMVNPDFAKVGEAMNIRSWTVTRSETVETALQEAFAHNGPALVNIYTDPNALAMPPHITFEQIKGQAQTLAKMMFNGRSGEVIDIMESGAKYLRELL